MSVALCRPIPHGRPSLAQMAGDCKARFGAFHSGKTNHSSFLQRRLVSAGAALPARILHAAGIPAGAENPLGVLAYAVNLGCGRHTHKFSRPGTGPASEQRPEGHSGGRTMPRFRETDRTPFETTPQGSRTRPLTWASCSCGGSFLRNRKREDAEGSNREVAH